jgi:hypothetical protein
LGEYEPMPLYESGERCRYCSQKAHFHITAIEEGKADTFHLCLEHAFEKGPHSEAVFLPVKCPKCAGTMGSDWKGARMFMVCRKCGFKSDYPPPLPP